jgi:predicted outer membrane repeat protein
VDVPCDPDRLIAAISLANQHGGATLNLAHHCEYPLTTFQGPDSLPTIVVPLTINGNDAILRRTANAAVFRIFHIGPGGSLILCDASLTGGRSIDSDGGGAIRIDAGGTATITNAVFTKNMAAIAGGAINSRGVLRIYDSYFADNSAYSAAPGGAVFNADGVLIIDSSHFERNTATTSGGSVFSAGTLLRISDTTINDSSADLDGGGLLAAGAVTIVHSTFASNRSGRSGGGIYVLTGAVTIRDSLLRDNTAGASGAGIFNLAVLVVEDTRLRHNAAAATGGGILTAGNLTLRRVEISDNRAYGPGGIGAGITGGGLGVTISLIDTRVTGNLSTNAPAGVLNLGPGSVNLDPKSAIVDNDPTNCIPGAAVPGCFG